MWENSVDFDSCTKTFPSSRKRHEEQFTGTHKLSGDKENLWKFEILSINKSQSPWSQGKALVDEKKKEKFERDTIEKKNNLRTTSECQQTNIISANENR